MIFDKEVILNDLLKILENTVDWENFVGAIGPETRLVADLGFASADLVILASEIEEQYKRQNLPFYKLFMTANGRYVDDLHVSELVNFLHNHLNNNP